MAGGQSDGERDGPVLTDAEALAIHQAQLDLTGKALLSGDPTDFVPCFALPQLIRTFLGARLLETEADVRDVFFACHHHFRQRSVTGLQRIARSARQTAPDRIDAMHETHLFSGEIRLGEPFPVYTVLRLIGGRWQISGGDYAVEPGSPHDRALTSGGRPVANTGDADAVGKKQRT